MGARYDKYEPIAGGFRAKLAADLTFDAAGSMGPTAVSMDATGKIVVGTAGAGGFVGVIVKNVPMTPNLGSIAGQVNSAVPIGGKAGQVVDVMTDGEIVIDTPGLTAGTKYYANADGSLGTTNTNPYVGHTLEATRLIVRANIK